MTADITAHLEDVRTRLERLHADVLQQITALDDESGVPDAVRVAVDDRGLLCGITLDPTIRRRISPTDLAQSIDRAVRSAQQPATAVLRAIGVSAAAGSRPADAEEFVRAADLLGSVLRSITEEPVPRRPHVVAGTGVRASASYGVVRSVTCSPAWLARSTDLAIADEVVGVCRHVALASESDLGRDS